MCARTANRLRGARKPSRLLLCAAVGYLRGLSWMDHRNVPARYGRRLPHPTSGEQHWGSDGLQRHRQQCPPPVAGTLAFIPSRKARASVHVRLLRSGCKPLRRRFHRRVRHRGARVDATFHPAYSIRGVRVDGQRSPRTYSRRRRHSRTLRARRDRGHFTRGGALPGSCDGHPLRRSCLEYVAAVQTSRRRRPARPRPWSASL